MNYEEFYLEITNKKKKIKDIIALEGTLTKKMDKSLDDGDLQAATKLIADIKTNAQTLQAAIEEVSEMLILFDGKQYVDSGDFAQQMLQYCEKFDVNVVGTNPYEMFPFQVKINSNTSDVFIGTAKSRCLRPLRMIETMKKKIDKLNEKKGGVAVFAEELARAYDIAILRGNNGRAYKSDADLYLLDLYKLLTPMQRLRKEYDAQSFAFDLARLYSNIYSGDFSDTSPNGIDSIADGRKIQFGTTRNNAKSIRILDQNGKAQHIAEIRFYN